MVQRAKGMGMGRLAVRADHVKTEKFAQGVRPTSSLHQDGKISKRKTKKSKALSLDGLDPSPPSKKATHVQPNYMKSTSNSDLRKENSPVTHPQRTSSCSTKISRSRCSSSSPMSIHYPGASKLSPSSAAATLKKSSCLKLVRTLTKAPSFKPGRSTTAKIRTRGVAFAEASIGKETCSSTLKEPKFLACLMLNSGDTEVKGTTVFKVCSYTYCSLHGCHSHLPALKHFVTARRKILKAQKSAKVVPVSPSSFFCGGLGDKPVSRHVEFDTDFFVETYKNGKTRLSNYGRVDYGIEDGAFEFYEESEGDSCGDCIYRDEIMGSSACEECNDDGWEGDIDIDEKVESCPDAKMEIISIADNISEDERSSVTGAHIISDDPLLCAEADGTDNSGSPGFGCFNPQIDASPTGKELAYTKFMVAQKVGREDKETTRSKETSVSEILSHPQVAGISSKDSCGANNKESIRLIKISADDLGYVDNREGYRTDELGLNEDLTSSALEIKKAAGRSGTSPFQYATTSTGTKPEVLYSRPAEKPHDDLTNSGMIWRIDRREKFDMPGEEPRGFTPGYPNYLPAAPDPEAEKVDLRHQMIEDRRSSEEWMIDYVLRQTVSNLAPARKKKVELLVEAFERVMPVSQFETHIKSSTTGVTRRRSIQACS